MFECVVIAANFFRRNYLTGSSRQDQSVVRRRRIEFLTKHAPFALVNAQIAATCGFTEHLNGTYFRRLPAPRLHFTLTSSVIIVVLGSLAD